MKIVLATGVFFPDVGGPATHTRRLAEALTSARHQAVVVAYGESAGGQTFPFPVYRISRRWPGLIRWPLYFLRVFALASGADAVYAFDPTAAGLPAFVAARLLGKRFIIRVGGDPIWERVVEQGKRFLSLVEYYEQGLARVDRPALFFLIGAMLRRAQTIVFYNDFFKHFYVSHFGILPERVAVIKNPTIGRQPAPPPPHPPVFLFAGRFVAYKNLPLAMRAFNRVWLKHGAGRLELVGAGPDESGLKALASVLPAAAAVKFLPPLPQAELFERIKEASVCLAPALSEFNPNFILEGLSFGRPALISRGNGLSVSLPDDWQFDPKSEAGFAAALERFYDEHYLTTAAHRAAELSRAAGSTWKEVIAAHFKLLGLNP